jgi:hypothetical protein
MRHSRLLLLLLGFAKTFCDSLGRKVLAQAATVEHCFILVVYKSDPVDKCLDILLEYGVQWLFLKFVKERFL